VNDVGRTRQPKPQIIVAIVGPERPTGDNRLHDFARMHGKLVEKIRGALRAFFAADAAISVQGFE
jgi:hypothetical protein